MNKKRIFALILSICLIFNVLPFSAFTASGEEATTVVNGKYSNKGVWGVGGDGTLSYDDGFVELSKIAKATSDPNKFDITLGLKTRYTKNYITHANATALVFDVSNSMEETIGGYNGEEKLAAAKSAALDFLKNYEGVGSGMECYISVVKFSDKATVVNDWLDVSIPENYEKIKKAINNVSVPSGGCNSDGGGTNMDDGLDTAKSLFNKQTVSEIGKDYCFTVVLSDGNPTYANGDKDLIGNGSSCTKSVAEKTAATATELRKKSNVFTIYFGSTTSYTNTMYKSGPTYKAFLTNSIANKATDKITYAYNANSKDSLTQAYNTIFGNFYLATTHGTTGDGLYVIDPMGEGIKVISNSNLAFSGSNNIYTWKLNSKNAQKEVIGNTTYCTYTLKYSIEIDTKNKDFDEDKFYPANGRTYFVVSESEKYEFPVPGVKGKSPRYTVTFNQGTNGTIEGADKSGNVVVPNVKWGSDVPNAPKVTADSDYYFVGWTIGGNIVDLSTLDIEKDTVIVAKYAKKGIVTLVGESNEVYYNSTEQSISDFEVQGVQKNALTGVTYGAKGTNVGTYNATFDAKNAKITIDGKDVTYKYKIVEQPGSLVIKKQGLLITAGSDQKIYDGKKLSCEEYTQEGLQGKDTIKSVQYKSSDLTDAGEYANEVSNAVVLNSDGVNVNNNYDIKYVPGKLTINKVPEVVVTITGNYEEYIYDGTEKTVTGYKVDIKQPKDTIAYSKNDIICSLNNLTVKGKDADDYSISLTKDMFTNNNKNYDVTFVVNHDIGLLIKGNASQIVITAKSDSKVYDGTPLTKNDYSYTGTLASGDTLTAVVSGTITDAGEQENKIVSYKIENSSKQDVTANYTNVTTKSGKLTVTKKAVTITSPSQSQIYNGKALISDDKDFKIEGFVSGEGVTIKNKASITDVGSKSNTFEFDYKGITKADNYTVTPIYGTLTVEKFSGLIIYINGNSLDSFPYDAKEHTVSGYEISFDKDQDAQFCNKEDVVFVPTDDCKKAEVSGTEAGDYGMGLTEANFKYNNSNVDEVIFVVTDGGFTINPVGNITVNVTGHTSSVVYNGTEQKVDGYDLEIASDASGLFKTSYVSFSGTASASGLTKGNYPMNLDASQFGSNNKNFANIIFKVTDGGLTISPITDNDKVITVSASTESRKYNGAPLNATYDYDYNDKAADIEKDGFDLLTKNKDTLTATAHGTITDAGSTTSSIVDGSVQIMHDNGDGTFTDVTSCYTFGTAEGKLTVNKRDVTLTSDTPERKEYDGTPLASDKVDVSGDGFVAGEGVNISVTGSQLNKGTSDNTFTYSFKTGTKEANYNITTKFGKLIVDAVSAEVIVTIKGHNDTKTYDGTAKKVEGYDVTDISNTLYKEEYFDFSGTDKIEKTNAGTYPMGLKEADFANNSDNFANVKFIVTDGELKISKANATSLDATGYEGTYDAKNHDAITDVEVKGDVKGTKWTYKYKDSKGNITDTIPQVKDAGEYEYTVIASNENYEDIETKITVKISPATIKVKADDKEQIIGEEKAELTYTYENPIKGEGPVFSGKLSTDAKDERGKYDIKQGDLALKDGEGFKASNYKIEYTPATYKVLLKDFTLNVDVDKKVAKVGDTITYTVTVKNNGDVDLSDLVLTSELIGIREIIKSLKVGETWTKQYTYVVKPEDAGKDIVNVFKVSGKDGKVLSEVSTAATTIEIPVSPKTGDTTNPFTMLIPMLVCASYISMYSRKRRQSR